MYKNKNPKKNRKKILYIFHMESWQIDMFLLKLWDIRFFMFFDLICKYVDYLDYLLSQGGNSKLKAVPLHIEEMSSSVRREF